MCWAIVNSMTNFKKGSTLILSVFLSRLRKNAGVREVYNFKLPDDTAVLSDQMVLIGTSQNSAVNFFRLLKVIIGALVKRIIGGKYIDQIGRKKLLKVSVIIKKVPGTLQELGGCLAP